MAERLDKKAESPGRPSVTAKKYRLGTHRVCSPEETWERVQSARSLIGVTRVADVTGLDCLGAPVFQAVRPLSRNISVSQGKGATPAAARTGALMEALESWHAESLEHLVSCRASLREMTGRNPISADQLRWRRGARPLPDLPLPWLKLNRFGNGPPGFLPLGMLELDFSAPASFEPCLFAPTSNGLASGNCLEEALLHGLCEWIERHGLHQSRLEAASKRPVDPASIPGGPAGELLDRMRRAGMKFAVYDLTWEAGLPVVLAELVADDLPVIWRGSGCHTSREIALSRALTEAAQSRLTYIAGVRDDLVELSPSLEFRADFQAYRAPEPVCRFQDLPDLSGATVAGDLARTVRALDIRRPESGIRASVAVTFVGKLREIDG